MITHIILLLQKSMIKLLERNSFVAPEIEIFKNVAKWCNVHNDVDDLVKQCVRLSSMTVVDIVSTVWPSKLFDCEKLLQAIAEIVGVKTKTSTSRGFYRKNLSPNSGKKLSESFKFWTKI